MITISLRRALLFLILCPLIAAVLASMVATTLEGAWWPTDGDYTRNAVTVAASYSAGRKKTNLPKARAL